MRRFAQLYSDLDASQRTLDKLEALESYFREAPPADAAWALHFLSGGKVRRAANATELRTWASEAAGLSLWLFEECYEAVGDLAETVTLVLPDPERPVDLALHQWVENTLLPIATRTPDQRRAEILELWATLDRAERLVANKLLTGAFRVGVARTLLLKGLARIAEVPVEVLQHRFSGGFTPSPESFLSLSQGGSEARAPSHPYPFFLAHALDQPVEKLGAIDDWQAEWKWDGIRAQIVRRAGSAFVWTRGEELATGRFPEIEVAASTWPDGTVVDGEIVGWEVATGQPMLFAALQRRIQRKTVGPKLLREVPVRLIAYDLLEWGGEDLRERPLTERRGLLDGLVGKGNPGVGLSELLTEPSWDGLAALRETSRERLAEGLMLKRLESPYGVGRKRGDWWKWKIDPYSMDAVLIYAQAGHGRRASLYTDYTFGVWDGDELVPVAKAYSGLTDEEIREVDSFVRRNTLERFGPVRRVEPKLVFEIAFEGIQKSPRHKSGIAVRFPRMARWRPDKQPADADRLEDLRAMIAGVAPGTT